MDVVVQLFPTLIAIQTPQRLAKNQENPAPLPVPSLVMPILDDPIQGVTLANTKNLSTARQPISLAEKPTVFMMGAKVGATL